jgi:hypothetical protein
LAARQIAGRFRGQHPRTGERIMRYLAQLLADRLIVANAKVNLLTAGWTGARIANAIGRRNPEEPP